MEEELGADDLDKIKVSCFFVEGSNLSINLKIYIQ